MTYPVTITLITIAALIAIFAAAHFVDKRDRKSSAQNLFRAAKIARVRTYITESNKDPRIVGEVVNVPPAPRSARIRDIDPVGA